MLQYSKFQNLFLIISFYIINIQCQINFATYNNPPLVSCQANDYIDTSNTNSDSGLEIQMLK